jgi:hypothetical protein
MTKLIFREHTRNTLRRCEKCKKLKRGYHVPYFSCDLCYNCYDEWNKISKDYENEKILNIRKIEELWKGWMAGKINANVKVMLI